MFKNIWQWLTNLISNFAKKLEKPAEMVLKVVNVLKDYVYNGAVDFITQLTTTKIDDIIIEKVKEYLPGVIKGILLAQGIITDIASGNLNSLLKLFANFITNLPEGYRGVWWTEIAARLLQLVSGQPVPLPVTRAVTQAKFSQLYVTA